LIEIAFDLGFAICRMAGLGLNAMPLNAKNQQGP
jgi:hypothetical protein